MRADELRPDEDAPKLPPVPRDRFGDESSQMPAAARRLTGAGLELAGFALILGGLGYWLDRKIGWPNPYLGIFGVLAGFSLGMWRLILIANQMNDETASKRSSKH